MPSKTLREVVDSYLIKTSGFRVNSIFDTEEAESAAKVAEEVFYYIVEKAPDLQFTEALIHLDHANDVDAPNYLRIPDAVSRIYEADIKYNNRQENRSTNYLPVKYLDPRDFLDHVSRNTSDLDDTEMVTDPSTGVEYLIINNKHPQYYTSFDGTYLAFDSYDKDYDTTLQSSQSLALVSKEPIFLIQDDFRIPLPNHLIPMYIDGVVAECAETIRQEAMPMVRRRYQAELAKLQRTNQRVGSMKTPRQTYGRRR